MHRFAQISLLVAPVLAAPLLLPAVAMAAPQDLPLLTFDQLQYEGAFRLPADTYGESSLNYSEGPLAYNPTHHSIFIVGHAHHQAVAEFPVPGLVGSNELSDLEMSAGPIQPFATLLDRSGNGNPQELDRIGGLAWFPGDAGGELVVNAYEYYDAPGDNSQTTLSLRDADTLAGSDIDGFFTFSGGAGHTSGWISPIPSVWQDLLGGSHITGQSSGLPIIGRLSVGPSAFAFDQNDIVGNDSVPEPIPTITLLDFSLQNPLHADLSNDSRENDLWTHLSRAVYGFIVPGTRTYATFGHSGGHVSGVCYKCIQTDGHECGGYCPPDPNDLYLYYWLWDVNDLLAVKEGTLAPHEVRPYEYDELPAAFPAVELGGGSFDPDSGLLYLTLQRADREQGTYSNPPVVAAYSFQLETTGVAVEDPAPSTVATRIAPNPATSRAEIRFQVRTPGHVRLEVFDTTGRLVRTLTDGTLAAGEFAVTWNARDTRGAGVPPGVYYYRVQTEDGAVSRKFIITG